MQFEFIKCHGSGNDFPMLDMRGVDLPEAAWRRVAVALADRAGPVGGDGILLLGDGEKDAQFSMVMRNSDGSEAETCLNGLRCVARAGFAALRISRARVRLKTSFAEVARDEDLAPDVFTVRETAGPASLDMTAWPADVGTARLIDGVVPGLGSVRRFSGVAMPNPHFVAFVDAIDDDELAALGAVCEAAPVWLPNRANVSLAQVRGEAELFVRTCERGVGLTDSCGSAMAATTYAACLTGRIGFGRDVVVRNRGGLVRALAGEDGMVTLSGNATFEYRATLDVDLASGATGPVTILERYPEEVAAWERATGRAT